MRCPYTEMQRKRVHISFWKAVVGCQQSPNSIISHSPVCLSWFREVYSTLGLQGESHLSYKFLPSSPLSLSFPPIICLSLPSSLSRPTSVLPSPSLGSCGLSFYCRADYKVNCPSLSFRWWQVLENTDVRATGNLMQQPSKFYTKKVQ